MSKYWLILFLALAIAGLRTTLCEAQSRLVSQYASKPHLEPSDAEVPVVTGGVATSFEKAELGPFDNLHTEVGTWTVASGKTVIDDKHAKSGNKCLHLTGGKKTTVVLKLKEKLGAECKLTFWAERWTSRKPFAFRIHCKTENGWSLAYDGNQHVRVGRAFLSQVSVVLSDATTTHLKFEVQSPPGTGILIDDLSVAATEPQRITLAEVIPVVLPALVNAEACPLLKIRIETSGSKNPIKLTSVSAALRASMGSITSVAVYATGKEAVFRPTKMFGKPFHVPDDSGKPMSEPPTLVQKTSTDTQILIRSNLMGPYELAEGENFFWLSCRLAKHADIDHTISASCHTLKFSNGATYQFANQMHEQRIGVALRTGGDDGVHTYRIPGLAKTPHKTLIAVYDVRRRSGRDLPGDIDVGMSRSSDGGRTWEPMKVIMDMGKTPKWNYDGIGDPAILVDQRTGTIWVAATWSHGNRSWRGSGPGINPEATGQLMLVKSIDDGLTWSDPINITAQIKRPEWSFVLQGPGKGITMQNGTIVFAAQYQDAPEKRRLPHSTIIYSHDQGTTWKIGNGAFDDTTEAQVIEVEPGVLMLNCRYNRAGVRVVMTTRDMGKTWQAHASSQNALIEPNACMGSLIDVGAETGATDANWLLFSNPDHPSRRTRITIKASPDRGMNWPTKHQLLLDELPSAGYSCMAMIDRETIGILYEGSLAHMTFQRIPLSEVIQPKGGDR